MTKDFKKFLTESELKLDPKMRVGDKLRLTINAKDVREMVITEMGENQIKAIEDLKGGQKKLDKNHNNKLDAEDFKMLRHEKDIDESSESSIAAKIKSLLDSGEIVKSQAAGRVGEITGTDGNWIYIKSPDGRKGVTTFHSGDPVKLFKRKDGTYVVHNTGKGASDWGFGARKGDQSIDEGFKVGEKVRLTNPLANPGYEIVGKDATHYHVKMHDGRTQRFPKERIHRVNQIGGNKYFKPSNIEVEEGMFDKFRKRMAAKSKLKDLDIDAADDAEAGLAHIPSHRHAARIHNVLYPKKPKRELPHYDAPYNYEKIHGKFDEAGKKPDYLDFDKDGDKDEPMTKALKDKEKNVKESSLFQTILRNAGLKIVTESDLNGVDETSVSENGNENVTEATMDISDIIEKYPDEVEAFENNNPSKEFEDLLYDYYLNSGEMPYGVAKARTGDPSSWIGDQFEQDLAYYRQHQNKSMEEQYELNEGRLVYLDDTYDLKLDHNTRTWSAEIWTNKKR